MNPDGATSHDISKRGFHSWWLINAQTDIVASKARLWRWRPPQQVGEAFALQEANPDVTKVTTAAMALYGKFAFLAGKVTHVLLAFS